MPAETCPQPGVMSASLVFLISSLALRRMYQVPEKGELALQAARMLQPDRPLWPVKLLYPARVM